MGHPDQPMRESAVDQPITHSDPPYLQIASEIRDRIASGVLEAGDRVPSTRQITQEWGVAMATATRALSALRQEGLVRVVPGVGTVVEPRAAQRRDRVEPAREAAHGLTHARIVAAAIEIADGEGLAAVSMRRVGAQLDAAPMSLYRHVADKDGLLVAMMDSVFGEAALPDPAPPGWRPQLELICRVQWSIYQRHPWMSEVLSFSRPQPTANALPHTEWALRAVDGLGLDPGTMLYVALTLFSYVRGAAVNLASDIEAEASTGLTDEEYLEVQAPALEAIVTAGHFPFVTTVFAQLDADGFDLDATTLFEFGLRRLIDGLAVMVGIGQP
jgi:DNA-binding transcriptional regulator YhcF (GntR family)